jgi:hypothetical protein
MELHLDERARRTPVVAAEQDVDATVKKSKRWYIAWWVAMPAVVFAISFTVLCIEECTALPWLTFLLAPIASVLLGIVYAIFYWAWSASLPSDSRQGVRSFILKSIVWGPCVAVAAFYALVTAISVSLGILNVFS